MKYENKIILHHELIFYFKKLNIKPRKTLSTVIKPISEWAERQIF